MEDGTWWITVLKWTLLGVLMSIAMGWLGKSRLRTRPASEARRLVHPLSVLIIGLINILFLGGIAVISNVISNPTTTWWTTAIFVGGTLLGVTLVSTFFLEKYDVSEEGLSGRNFVGVRKQLPWAELCTVRYSPNLKQFRLETRSGSVARVSVMLMGLPEFARLLLQNVPGEAIDARALEVLQATAAGNPPPIWG